MDHPLSTVDTSSNDLMSTIADEGYDSVSQASISTIIHGACLTLGDHNRIHVFM